MKWALESMNVLVMPLSSCEPLPLLVLLTAPLSHRLSGFCDPNQPVTNGWCMCSLGWCKGEPQVRPQAWAPQDLDQMILQHDKSGPELKTGGAAAGYNEIVLGSEHWVAALPRSIEAFFYVQSTSDDSERSSLELPTYAASQFAFKMNYGSRSDLPPPLLSLRPDDWEKPFALG